MDSPEVDQDLVRMRPRWLTSLDASDYVLTRFVFLRFLGLIYSVAFAVASNQLVPLVGSHGLEPADRFLDNVAAQIGSGEGAVRLPTLFWLGASDGALRALSFVGLILSMALLFGFTNSITLFILWLFYLSIVPVGQVFWGY